MEAFRRHFGWQHFGGIVGGIVAASEALSATTDSAGVADAHLWMAALTLAVGVLVAAALVCFLGGLAPSGKQSSYEKPLEHDMSEGAFLGNMHAFQTPQVPRLEEGPDADSYARMIEMCEDALREQCEASLDLIALRAEAETLPTASMEEFEARSDTPIDVFEAKMVLAPLEYETTMDCVYSGLEL